MRTWMPFALAAALALPAIADEPTPESLFHEGWSKETELKDLEGAISSYKQAVARAREEERYAARAQYQIGVCLEKMGKAEEARAAFQEVVKLYPEQKEWVDKANKKLKPDETSETVLKKLQTLNISLDFNDAPFPDVVTYFREFAQVNMILDAAVEKADKMRVTIEVDNIPFVSALTLTVKMLELDWCVEKGVVIVSTKAGVEKREEARRAPSDGDEEEAAWKAELERTIESQKLDLDFTDATLEDIIGFIREHAKMNIVLDPKLRSDGTTQKKMTLQLRDVTLKSALKLTLDQLGLTYELSNHVLLITRDEHTD